MGEIFCNGTVGRFCSCSVETGYEEKVGYQL